MKGKGEVLWVSLLLLPGCSPPDEDAATRSRRESLSRLIAHTPYLEFAERNYIPDGGSVDYGFRSDSGSELVIELAHQNEAMGGNPRYQAVWISDSTSKEGVEVKPGSPLESRLLRLVETCRVGPTFTENGTVTKMTPDIVPGLIWKIRMRTVK